MGLFLKGEKQKRWMFLLVYFLLPILSVHAFAQAEEKKTVRVGYYEDHNFQAGAQEGMIKSGYSFEYLQRLQMHTNWEYEYVYGGFDEMYKALLNGDVDILTGLAYKEERAELFSYPELAMGQTVYSMVKKQDRYDITSSPKTLARKKIGALEGPMLNALQTYLKDNSVDAQIVVFTDLYERDDALMDGSVDAVILESSATSAMQEIEAFAEVGANDYYVCVAKNRPDILEDVNQAQRELFHAKPRLKEELYDKWLRHNIQSAALSDSEKEWVEQHPEFRVGYFTTYLPYSGVDADGNVTGVVQDVVPEMLGTLGIQEQEVKSVYEGFDSYDEMIAALQRGEIDALFPAYCEYWSAEENEIAPTDGVINAYYNLVYKSDYPTMEKVHFAFRRSNLLVQAYAKVNFPGCEIVLYDTVQQCLDAVVDGKVDATLINGLRTPSYMLYDKSYSSLRFSQLAGNVPLGFGLRRNDGETVEVLNHAISLMDSDFALSRTHLYEQEFQMTTKEFILQNWWIIALPVMVVCLVILVAAIIELKRNRKTLLQEETYNQELTERLHEISKLKQEADAASKAKTDFLFSMSHDIRTPMNASMGFTELLEKNLDDPEKRQDYIRKIKDADQLLLSIINNVLEMSRIESGSIMVEEVVYASEQFNDAIASIFEEMMAQKDITFTRNIDIEHRYVYCDPIKLREIFVNIIGNAYKYTLPGGKVHMDLKELPSDREGWALFQTTITDTGIGMDPEFLPHVFDAFTREASTTQTKIEGTGLGLSIVKKLVELLDGTIEVTSEKGVGTSFIVRLYHRIASGDDLVKYEKVEMDIAAFKNKRILLAEDNELNAEIACEVLREVGFAVERAADGEICVDMLRKAEVGYYDLILMDIQMPNMNGYEAAKAIRSLSDAAKADIPIVAMTANAFEEDKRNAFAAGMNGHIAKPINLPELYKQLATVLG